MACEEEGTFMACEEEDTCMACEEEDTGIHHTPTLYRVLFIRANVSDPQIAVQ